MFKLQTELMHFRFNSIHNLGIISITWYKLINNQEAYCLTQIELNKLYLK